MSTEAAATAQQAQVCPAPKRLERGNLKTTEKFGSTSSTRRSQRLQSTAGPSSGRLKRHDGFSVASKESVGHERVRKASVRSHSSQQDMEQRPDILEVVMNNLVVLFVLLSLVLGFAIGAALNPLNLSELQRSLLRLPGELFVRVLQCLVIPLYITSVVSTLGGQPTAEGARLALCTVAYVSLVTLWSATSGMIAALLMRPGVGAKKLPTHKRFNATLRADSLLDIFRNVIPENVVEAFVFMTQSVEADHSASDHAHSIDDLPTSTVNIDLGKEYHLEKLAHTNFLGLLGFSALLGFALSQFVPAGRDVVGVPAVGADSAAPGGGAHYVLRLTRVLSTKFLRMTEKTLWFSPVAVGALVAVDVSRVSDLSTVVWHLGLFSFTVLLGLGVHAFLFLPALYMIKVRRDAGLFFLSLLHPLAIAFGSRSSMVGSPAAMAILEKKVGLHPDSVRLIVPLSTVINHDGTALYTMVSVLFAAQLQGESLTVSSLVVLLASCCIATIGEYGLMPSFRGPARAALLLTLVGLSPDNMGYMAVVHWLLQRAASTVDLLSDCVAAAVLQRYMLQTRQESTRSHSLRRGLGSIVSLQPDRDVPVLALPAQEPTRISDRAPPKPLDGKS
nr:excitatory amino acid transporter-like [Rhipicephalus microplus]